MKNTNTRLPRSGAQSIPSEAIAGFLHAADQANLELHSLIIVQRGSVLAEGWWSPYSPALPHMLYSLSKSFTSTAAGLAIAEGRFSLDDTVISFFPDDLPAPVSENLRAMRVRDLLAMATGHTQEPMLWKTPEGSNWVRQFLAQPVEKEPGSHFLYNSAATYMVSAIVEQATGEGLLSYLTPRLLAPLGIEGAKWETDPRGIAVGGWGLNITTEDIACFGQLYLQNGVWNGARLLPEGWVETATSKHVSNGDDASSDWNQGYGFQFWRCRNNAYRGDGAFGQFCVVLPDQEAVVAITSGVGNGEMPAVLSLVWKHLLPALADSSTAHDPAAHEELTARLARLSIPFPQGQATSPVATRVSGATYQFAENDQNLASVAFDLDGDDCVLTFSDTDGKAHRVDGSLRDWKTGTTTFLQSNIWRMVENPMGKTAVRGAWTEENTLAFKLCFTETPFSPTLTFHFDSAEKMTLNIRGPIGFGPIERAPLEGHRD